MYPLEADCFLNQFEILCETDRFLNHEYEMWKYHLEEADEKEEDSKENQTLKEMICALYGNNIEAKEKMFQKIKADEEVVADFENRMEKKKMEYREIMKKKYLHYNDDRILMKFQEMYDFMKMEENKN